ncbi:uncharacterized protein Z518_03686 [Rhinocladiella mackenziei CBS 650.93]|uniref:Uncharacterized protein n=1 Tax=Rhinocladiella mackenziei CBS 650.93 TaxID=1442369 RepID=A0A0D2IIZ5_9EURO|nr:uncharacterized protein Z518_03686 [Rhinocladiella mackenziei CBS 650.93]KIX05714.1 hypothetical protein Z518_03686 [Rhinocladiella mackenziei CBS 650.93]
MQEAPGVGMALGFDHATVSVQFWNGTVIDSAYIDGPDSYTTAMTTLSELSEPRASSATLFGVRDVLREKATASTGIWSYIGAVQKYLPGLRIESSSPAHVEIADALMPIAEVLRTLFQQVAKAQDLHYRYVYVSFPDFVNHGVSALDQILSLLLENASLQSYGGMRWIRTRAALNGLYHLGNCFDTVEGDPDDYGVCDKYKGRKIQTALGIELSEKNFCMHLMPRENGLFFPDMASTKSYPHRGTASVNEADSHTDYWTWIKEELLAFVDQTGKRVDLLVLHGTQITNPQLQSLIKDVFQDNPNIKSEEYLRSVHEHIFAPARSVAETAKSAMWDGLDACIPNPACPISEHYPPGQGWRRPGGPGLRELIRVAVLVCQEYEDGAVEEDEDRPDEVLTGPKDRFKALCLLYSLMVEDQPLTPSEIVIAVVIIIVFASSSSSSSSVEEFSWE